MSRQQGYAILRATGRPMGPPRNRPVVDPQQLVAVFDASGSVDAAAKASGISHSRHGGYWWRRAWSARRQVRGKPEAKGRFVELLMGGVVGH